MTTGPKLARRRLSKLIEVGDGSQLSLNSVYHEPEAVLALACGANNLLPLLNRHAKLCEGLPKP